MKRMKTFPMGIIDKTEMRDTIGTEVRKERKEDAIPLNPTTVGVYIVTMMAQIDVLKENGHCYSEIVNESVIEAVDSLNPYMHFKGVSYMVDNCSTTARLGSHKWAPRFYYLLCQNAYTALDAGTVSASHVEDFKHHPVHDAVTALLDYRPSVDIAVQ